MMIIITLQEALANHPTEVSVLQTEAAQRLKKSKSKTKGTSIAELQWYYETATVITNSGTLANVFFGQMKQVNMSLEEKIQEQISNTRVSLCAKMKGSYAKTSIQGVPQKIQDNIKAFHEEQEKESIRWNALSQQDKDNETKNLLNQLSRSPGFMAFKI